MTLSFLLVSNTINELVLNSSTRAIFGPFLAHFQFLSFKDKLDELYHIL